METGNTNLPHHQANPIETGKPSAPAVPAVAAVPERAIWHPSRFFGLVRGRPILLLSLALALLFGFLTVLVIRADLQPTPWDIYITSQVQLLPAEIGAILIWVSEPGFYPWNFVLAGVLVLVLALFKLYTETIFAVLAAAGGLFAELVKNIIDRPRPTPEYVGYITSHLQSYSFPSGHVTGYVTIFGFLFYLVYILWPRKHRLRVPLLALAAGLVLLVGPSRVYMGQHWASDALAGYALGFAYLFIIIELHRFWIGRHPVRQT